MPGRLLLCLCPLAAVCLAGELDRAHDPVVLRGSQAPTLLGASPAGIVAFAHNGGWIQIPVQIDERKLVDYGVVYDLGPVGLMAEAYADAATYCGADDNPDFDSDDELALMAADAGPAAPLRTALPDGVLNQPAVELRIADPLDGGEGYIYLFVTDGSLTPDAGQDYVTYTFDLLAGPYIPNYNTLDGPNPESSSAGSASYSTHFTDRWIRDEIRITAGSARGVDILDRHKALFAPGDCTRSEDTFSDAEGAFFCNLDGPIRGIRSYLGANSGPLTQREHVFYAAREDVGTFLRVHAIDGVMDLFDYSPDAVGMAYQHDLVAAPVIIDGEPDTITAGAIGWELVTGPQGSLIMRLGLETDIPDPNYTSFHEDDATPRDAQCTGDAFAYGTSGQWIDHPIPNTDPFIMPLYTLTGRRVIYYEAPGQTAADAELRASQAAAPLVVTASIWPGGCIADLDGDGQTGQGDLGVLLAAFGTCPGDTEYNAAAGELAGDACVTQTDLGVLLGDFGCGGE